MNNYICKAADYSVTEVEAELVAEVEAEMGSEVASVSAKLAEVTADVLFFL